ncbi:MAG TPA: UDP-2,3-diacylglucosamine diphosphatase LpxI [Anaeromyxobacteraceae bacterium]|nr:UDP-2,3-diacylglucosamine diphosphatase LpxI [Anaeromyxobacteraceae bacterium]
MATIGLIAGSGGFPLLFARGARRAGHRVVAAAHVHQTDKALEHEVDQLTWVKLGQFGKVAEILKAGGATQSVMLGAIAKKRFFLDAMPDAIGLELLARVAIRSDDNLLRTIAAMLAEHGFPVIDPTPFLTDALAPEGVLGRHQPTEAEWADARYGLELARAIGRLDLGQTVVVKDRCGVAVEALEGTDACIARGGELARAGAVVVKAVKPQQDRRFDLPAVGPGTVESMRKAGCRVLAVEAGATLVMDLDELVRRADRAGIAVVGLR